MPYLIAPSLPTISCVLLPVMRLMSRSCDRINVSYFKGIIDITAAMHKEDTVRNTRRALRLSSSTCMLVCCSGWGELSLRMKGTVAQMSFTRVLTVKNATSRCPADIGPSFAAALYVSMSPMMLLASRRVPLYWVIRRLVLTLDRPEEAHGKAPDRLDSSDGMNRSTSVVELQTRSLGRLQEFVLCGICFTPRWMASISGQSWTNVEQGLQMAS